MAPIIVAALLCPNNDEAKTNLTRAIEYKLRLIFSRPNDDACKQKLSGAINLLLSLGFAATTKVGMYVAEYQKHFTSYLYFSSDVEATQKNSDLTPLPIHEVAESLIALLSIALKVFDKANLPKERQEFLNAADTLLNSREW